MEVLYTRKSSRFCWELDPLKLFEKDQCTMILVRGNF